MTERYRPNTTVAWVIESPQGFLFVEENIRGNMQFNQPAGHIEAGETLIEAAKRELHEETSLQLEPEGLVGIYQFPNQRGNVIYLRFCFYAKIADAPQLTPIDPAIHACHWLSRDDIAKRSLRSQFVLTCTDDYLAGKRFSLDLLHCQLP
ncbi:NUDIX hydrolase [Neiella sp. HB171785]|uniref:Phosphatase NudJ n=1 Tax=Neiella litorisoli TaxID=2771431 RepID=A0A8J6QQ87_9GAMM|nr:NUDIX hydrolase [Neiella litorisoli]MBD1388534.1 NUDIX hydrolase [Neiella litorisoli]